MTANMKIESVTAYATSTTTTMMVLYSNTSPGVVKFAPGSWSPSSGMCTPGSYLPRNCPPLTSGIFDLFRLDLNSVVSNMCLDMYYCIAGEDCAPVVPDCTTFGGSVQRLTSPVVTANSSIPQTPVLTITSGDKFLDISWNNIPDPNGLPNVFAYLVDVEPEGIGGYLKGTTTAIRINGLTNNKTYNVTLKALTHNDVSSATVSSSGVPIGVAEEGGSKAATYVILAGIGLAGLYYVTKSKQSKVKT